MQILFRNHSLLSTSKIKIEKITNGLQTETTSVCARVCVSILPFKQDNEDQSNSHTISEEVLSHMAMEKMGQKTTKEIEIHK